MPYYHIHILATPFILEGQEWPSTRHSVGTAHSTTRANTCHAIFIFMFFYQLTMQISIGQAVERIRQDVCKDCKQKCGLCEHGVCQDVVTEVGCFFIYTANKEREEK